MHSAKYPSHSRGFESRIWNMRCYYHQWQYSNPESATAYGENTSSLKIFCRGRKERRQIDIGSVRFEVLTAVIMKTVKITLLWDVNLYFTSLRSVTSQKTLIFRKIIYLLTYFWFIWRYCHVSMVVTTSDTKMSRVRSSMTNNNGFRIGWLVLLTPSFTITLNHNQLQQLTINDCLRLTPFLTGPRVPSF
jgi:hypothetical protein